MLTVLGYWLLGSVVFALVWRAFLGPESRRNPTITLHFDIQTDYQTLQRLGREAMEREEVERLERMLKR